MPAEENLIYMLVVLYTSSPASSCTAERERDPNPGVLIQRAARRPQHPASGGSFLYYEGGQKKKRKEKERTERKKRKKECDHPQQCRYSRYLFLSFFLSAPFSLRVFGPVSFVFFEVGRPFISASFTPSSRLDRLLEERESVVTCFHRRPAFLAISPLNDEGFTHTKGGYTHGEHRQIDVKYRYIHVSHECCSPILI